MTAAALIDRPAPATPPVARAPLLRRVAPAAPWLLALATLAAALCFTGTPARDIAAYGGYWALGIVLPGTLTHRALRGSRGNLPEDLGFGAAVGLLLEVGAWAAAAATGQQALLRWWPAALIVAFLATPKLRRHWRIADPRPLPARWAWAMAAVLVLIVGWAAARWVDNPLPPVTFAYYQDLMYHLALAQEMTRAMPFQAPQLLGDPLRYHYLSDAHMATASMVTRAPLATVLLRLWIVPIAAVAALVTAGLARDLTGRWWAGPVTAAVAYVGGPLTLLAPLPAIGGSPLSYLSPSQTYALPFLLLLAVLCVDVVRGRPLGAGWALVPTLALACAGAKSSALPPLLAGLLLAGLALVILRRPLPWAALITVGGMVVAMAAGFRLFAGGGAGTLGVEPFSVLRWMAPYRDTLGATAAILGQGGGRLPPGLKAATGAGWLLVATIVLWWLLAQAARLVGLAGVAARRMRADPAAWLLAGTLVAGVGAAWVFHHPSASQVYFYMGAAPFGAVLSVWLLSLLIDAGVGWVPPAAAFAVGVAADYVWPIALPRKPPLSIDAWQHALTASILRVLALAVIATLVALAVHSLLTRRSQPTGLALSAGRLGVKLPAWRGGAAVASAAVMAAMFGASVAAGVDPTVARAVVGPLPNPIPPGQRPIITESEMRAALWLDAHAPNDEVVATNVHCQPVRTFKYCDARAFWVAGLGGHRTLVESWGYSDESVAANGRGGRSYGLQPAPNQDRYALNERAFTAPTPADLDRLRHEFGVRWLFADTRAGLVAPELATLAQVRLVAGPVTIYELP
jgi:hypothetical protein